MSRTLPYRRVSRSMQRCHYEQLTPVLATSGPILQGGTILAIISSGVNTGNSTTFPKTCSGADQYVDVYIDLADPPINAWIMGIVQGTGPVGLGPEPGVTDDLAEYTLGASPPPPGMTTVPNLQPPSRMGPPPAAPGPPDAGDQATPTAYNLYSLQSQGPPTMAGTPPPAGRHRLTQPSVQDVTLGSPPPPITALVAPLVLMDNSNGLMLPPPPASPASQVQSTGKILDTFVTSYP